MKRTARRCLRSKQAPFRPLHEVLRDALEAIGGRPHRVWRLRDAARHGARLLRNGADRQELQVLIDRANILFMLVPVPRYPARHHIINPPFRSSGRSIRRDVLGRPLPD